MKTKTSLALSTELIQAIEKYRAGYRNRSDFIEAAAWAFIHQIMREQDNARDLDIINHHADRLNAEAEDVLAYQSHL